LTLAAVLSKRDNKLTQHTDLMMKAKDLCVPHVHAPRGKQLSIFHIHVVVALGRACLEAGFELKRAQLALNHFDEALDLWKSDQDEPVAQRVISRSPRVFEHALAHYAAELLEILVNMLNSGIEYHQACSLDGISMMFDLCLHSVKFDYITALSSLLQFHDVLLQTLNKADENQKSITSSPASFAAPDPNPFRLGAECNYPKLLSARKLIQRSLAVLEGSFQTVLTSLNESAVSQIIQKCIVPMLQATLDPDVSISTFRFVTMQQRK
jgi:hypothetical protein